MVAAAIIGSSVVGAAASSSAANKQSKAASAATASADRQYEQSREDSAPWREAGVQALGQLTTGTAPGGEFNRDFTLADFAADPGYQFRINAGRDAVEGSAAARGSLLSGGTLKALTDYGQTAGSQEYGSAYSRYVNNVTTRFNRLSSIAGNGQTMTQNQIQTGANHTATTNELRLQGANAQASGAMGVSGAFNSGVNGYMTLQQLNRMGSPMGSPYNPSAGASGGATVGAPYSGGMVPIA